MLEACSKEHAPPGAASSRHTRFVEVAQATEYCRSFSLARPAESSEISGGSRMPLLAQLLRPLLDRFTIFVFLLMQTFPHINSKYFVPKTKRLRDNCSLLQHFHAVLGWLFRHCSDPCADTTPKSARASAPQLFAHGVGHFSSLRAQVSNVTIHRGRLDPEGMEVSVDLPHP